MRLPSASEIQFALGIVLTRTIQTCCEAALGVRVGDYTLFAPNSSCVRSSSATFAVSAAWQAFPSYLFVKIRIEESKSCPVLNC